jgi:hypothetical protein
MISDRPYSPAIPHDAALAELRSQRGTQFDPDLVDVFIALVGDGLTENGERYGTLPALVPSTPPSKAAAASREPATVGRKARRRAVAS